MTASVLTIDDLSRRFGNRWALARVSAEVGPGEGLAVVGTNGSGKTTLLRCLATAIKPSAGRVRYGAVDNCWKDRLEVRPRFALLTHHTRLYDDLSAAENLQVWADLAGTTVDVDASMAEVGLDASRPEPVRGYSAGMKRRLAMARALIKKPEVVLLDEPFASLDPEGRAMVVRIMQKLRDSGMTVIVATHLPHLAAEVCPQAIALRQGQIIYRGATAEVPL